VTRGPEAVPPRAAKHRTTVHITNLSAPRARMSMLSGSYLRTYIKIRKYAGRGPARAVSRLLSLLVLALSLRNMHGS
jgi:hypothetical protein